MSKNSDLVRKKRCRIGLFQEKFAAQLRVFFQLVNRWGNDHHQSLPITLELIERKLLQMGDIEVVLLAAHFDQEPDRQ